MAVLRQLNLIKPVPTDWYHDAELMFYMINSHPHVERSINRKGFQHWINYHQWATGQYTFLPNDSISSQWWTHERSRIDQYDEEIMTNLRYLWQTDKTKNSVCFKKKRSNQWWNHKETMTNQWWYNKKQRQTNDDPIRNKGKQMMV